jgi:hypothetical protein
MRGMHFLKKINMTRSSTAPASRILRKTVASLTVASLTVASLKVKQILFDIGMNRHRLLTLCLGLLAVWLQLVAPLARANALSEIDPTSIICSHPMAQPNDSSHPVHQKANHDCCTLCHVHIGTLPIDDMSVAGIFVYPAESLLKWRISSIPPLAGPDLNQHSSRGPPSLD